ncbi:MAG: PAS domain S-box protein, partial [Isosphaeraceae bacterium]|nr:PAS domain S-box protein [Isosphaeraceae bacterium]
MMRNRPQAASQPVTHRETLAILDITREELRVAEEELCRRSEELQAVQEALEAEQRHFREFFTFAPIGLLVTDLLGVIREANWAAAALLGIEPKFLLGKPLALFIPQEGRAAFRTELVWLLKDRDKGTYELRLQPRRQPSFFATATVSVHRDALGQPTALLWSLRDDTPIKKAEERLRQHNEELERRIRERTRQLDAELEAKEQLLIRAHAAAAEAEPARQLLELVQDLDAIIWIADAATGRFTFVSRRAEALLGYPVERWLTEPDFWTTLLHPDDREYALIQRERGLRERRSFQAEYRLIAASGRPVWFRESVRVILREPDHPHELRGLMVDISKRKKVERQLYTARQELATRLDDLSYLLELTDRLSGTLDLQAILEEILAGLQAILGAEAAALLLYDPVRDDLYPVANVGLEELLRRVGRVPAGVGVNGAALRARRTILIEDIEVDEQAAPYRAVVCALGFRAGLCTPLVTRSGEALGTLAAAFREPHRPPERQVHLVEQYARQAANAIEHARLYHQARQNEQRLEEFLRTVADELRGPLEVLRAASTPPTGKTTLDSAGDAIASSIERLAQLADDLRDASCLARGDLELRRRPLDLAEVVARTAQAARTEFENRDVALEVTPAPGPLPLE